MKKILIILGILFTLLLTSCGKEIVGNRFELIYNQRDGLVSRYSIYRDTETGKEYLFIKSGYGGGLTLLSK